MSNKITFLLFCLLSSFILHSQNKVVGYLPTYSNFPNSIYDVDLSVVTHIKIAFINPDINGNINIPAGIETVVNHAHANDVKVLISICGGAGDVNIYRTILSNENLSNNFINNLSQIANSYNLDGVDVDIEGNILDGVNVNASQYADFVSKLKTTLQANNKIITAALGSWFMNHITNSTAQSFDFISIMSYDAHGSWSGPGQHSTYQMAVNDFNSWRNKGVAANNLIVGVPFYGWGWGIYDNAWRFSEIIASFPGSENQDQVGQGNDVIYYNGIPTIRAKAEFAKENAGGIMIWELTQDAKGDNSLLKAIGDVFKSSENEVPDNLAKGKSVSASSVENDDFAIANINDGKYSTRWSSLYTDNEWVVIDLEKLYVIQNIKIFWEDAYATDYNIEFSNDGTNWSVVKNITSNNATENSIDINDKIARFVKIQGVKRVSEWGYSIYEVEIYGTETSTPFGGTPTSIPGKIEAENYDEGGNGVAYFDTDNTNIFGKYRNDGVDIEDCTDIGGGYNVGEIDAGEWLKYSVYVSTSGLYEFNPRIAAIDGSNSFSIEIDGVLYDSFEVPNTGGWQNWQSIGSTQSIYLEEGLVTIKVNMTKGPFNLNYIEAIKQTNTKIAENTSLFEIYPNPVIDILNIISDQPIEQIEISDMTGRIIKTSNIAQRPYNINIADLPNGIYFIKIDTKEYCSVEIFVKK